MEIVGVDLGGTNIKAGRVNKGVIEEKIWVPTPQTSIASEVVSAIILAIEKVMRPTTVAIGIGIPSVVDVEEGIVYDVANIPSWKKVPVKALLTEALGIPVFVNNDANCFAIGDKVYGNGKKYDNFVGLTLGTGLGAGIIQKGRLLEDANCGSGEFCIVPYQDADYESYCSSKFFSNLGLEAEVEYDKALRGDEESIGVFNQFGYHIAQLIKLVVATIDPQMIVFGGSISQAFSLFEPAMRKSLTDFPYQNSIERLQIYVSNPKDQGILGAAALCY